MVAISIVLVAVFVPVAFFPGHHGRHLPAVRAHHRRFGGPLDLLRADADPGAVARCSCASTRAEVALLPRGEPRRSTAVARLRGAARTGCSASAVAFIAVLRGRAGGDLPRSSARCPPASSRTRTRATSSSPCRARRACRWRRRRRSSLQRGAGAARARGGAGHLRHRRLLASWAPARTAAHLRHPEAVGRAAQARSHAWPGWSSGCAGRSAPSAALVLPFQPPAIRGVGSVGGFQFIVEDAGPAHAGRAGQRPSGAIAAAALREPKLAPGRLHLLHRRHAAARRRGGPRRRPRRWACRSMQIFGTLQTLHGQPVRQRLQLREPHLPRLRAGRAAVPRTAPRTSAPSTCAATSGEMIPLESLVHVPSRTTARADPSATTTCSAPRRSTASAAPGVCSGRGARGDGGGGRGACCLRACATSGPASASSRRRAAGQTLIIFALGIVFVFLVLAAQYESFALPLRDDPLGAAGHPRRAAGCRRRAAWPTTSSARSGW